MIKGLLAVAAIVSPIVTGIVTYKVIKKRRERESLMGKIMMDIISMTNSLKQQKGKKTTSSPWETLTTEDHIRELKILYRNLQTANNM